MRLFRPFKRPIENETLDSWAKNLEDIAKVAIVSFPILIYGEYGILFKLFNLVMLASVIYFTLGTSRILRNYKQC